MIAPASVRSAQSMARVAVGPSPTMGAAIDMGSISQPGNATSVTLAFSTASPMMRATPMPQSASRICC